MRGYPVSAGGDYPLINMTIDIACEMEHLQLQYEKLNRKKKEKEERKMNVKNAIARGPTERQKQLYEEGRMKLLLQRSGQIGSEGSRGFREDASSQRDAPLLIPVCDRLYEQGMEKVRAQKLAEQREVINPSSSRSKPTPIPVCDRLYKEGINKQRAEKIDKQRAEKKLERCLNNRGKPTPIPVCDRLYKEGMNKINGKKFDEEQLAREQELQQGKNRVGLPPLMPVCDRLYMAGMKKILMERGKNHSGPDLCQQKQMQLLALSCNDTYSIVTDTTDS